MFTKNVYKNIYILLMKEIVFVACNDILIVLFYSGPLLKEMSQSNASLASSTSSSMRKHIPAKKFVPKRLLANNFSNDVLFNAKFPPDAGEEELGNLMATALGEQFPVTFLWRK